MTELSEPVVGAIVRGMSAYMQGANRTDLPSALRPLQGKHLKMLTARKGDIIAALENDGLRAMLLDWLENKPTGITKADAKILATVARREDGWTEELAGAAPARRGSAKKEPDLSGQLEREKEKARKARDELRRVKEESSRSVSEMQREIEKLRSALAETSARLRAAEKETVATGKDRDAARAEMEREVRKARRRVEKAEAAVTEAKSTSSQLRAELTAARRAAPAPARKKQPTTGARVTEPATRRRLSAPKGRLAEAPETLTEWLSTPEVHLLVDGYNVSKAEGGFGDLRLETQRNRLLQEVGKVARRHKIKATVIFDGSEIAPGTSRRARGPVEVEYSRPTEIADDHLIAKLEVLPKHPVVVATNDKELQHRAARLGATIATSDQLLGLIRS